jgi:hypothetical protein
MARKGTSDKVEAGKVPDIVSTALLKHRVGKWSKRPVSTSRDDVRVSYMKISREPKLERNSSVAMDYMKTRFASVIMKEARQASKSIPEVVIPSISPEEAEKITDEMINTFSKTRGMRDLLEGAKFFAGASTLSGAVTVRRARQQITRFELYSTISSNVSLFFMSRFCLCTLDNILNNVRI